MKELELNQMELIDGQGFWDGFCKGFAATAIVFEAGVLANIWNPVGQAGAIVMIGVAATCLVAT